MIFEAENEEFEKKLMWEYEEVQEASSSSRADTLDETPQFVIDDEDEDEDASTADPSKSPASPISRVKSADSVRKTESKETLPTLAERLIACTIDLLFCCGFTLPTKIQVDHHKIDYVIWYSSFVFYAHHSHTEQLTLAGKRA